MDKEDKDSDDVVFAEIDSLKLLKMISTTSDIVQEAIDKFYKKFKLSKTQFGALYIVYLGGAQGVTLSTLGESMSVTRSNITTLVDRIVSRGLIQRITNKDDRRSIKAVITDKGRELVENVLPDNQVFSSEVLNFLTSKEKERFYELLLKIQEDIIEKFLKD